MQFAVFYVILCGVLTYFCSVLQYSYLPYIVHLPASPCHFIKEAFNQVNMVCHTYNCKKKLEELFTLSSELSFLADLVF